MSKKNPYEPHPYPAKKIKTFPKVSKTTIDEQNFNINLKTTKPLRDYELAHIVQVILSMPLIWDSTNKYYKLNDNTTKLSDLLTELEAKLETADLSIEAVTKYLNANIKNTVTITATDLDIRNLSKTLDEIYGVLRTDAGLAYDARDRNWTITETVPISNANLDVALSTRLKIADFALTQELGKVGIILSAGGAIIDPRSIRALTSADVVSAVKSGTWNIDNLLNPHPVSLTSIPNPSNLDVALSTRLKPADLNLDADKDLQVDVKTLPATVIAGMTSLPAGTNNIGDVDVLTLPTIPQSTKHDAKTYKTAVFDASASGNLVAAVANKVIKLHALTIQAQGTVTVNLNNGSAGASLMEWSFQAREGAVIPMANAPAYWAVTSVNTALYVTLSAAVVVTITAIYSDDDAS
jgi:hypothetical protein